MERVQPPTKARKLPTKPTFRDQIKPPVSPKPPVRVVYITTDKGTRIPS